MAKAETKIEAEPETDASVDTGIEEGAVPPAPKRSKLKLLAIGGVALTLCLGGGGYFALPMALAMFAPAGDGATREAAAEEAPSEGGGHGGGSEQAALPAALPVERLALPARAAGDYQIVSIYDGEAFLATSDAVIRVKVGSSAPGLGDILAIEASDSGGMVTGTLATLKTS